MRNNKRAVFSWILIAALSSSYSFAKDNEFYGEIWDSVCAKTGSHDAMMKKAGVNTTEKCTIGCAMMRGKYVLYDPAAKRIYNLDDQKTPLEFAAKKVRVAGTLDKATSTIHVTHIELAH
jgi:hypothetical protein